MKKFNKFSIVTALVFSLVIGFTIPYQAFAVSSPSLGTTASYGIISSTLTANTAVTTVAGSVGYTTLSGSGTISVSGTTSIPAPAQSGTDQATALASLNSQTCVSLGTNVTLSGIYTPGCYSSTGTMDIVVSTTVTLNGAGTYIFRSGGAITTGANSVVALTGGASACDVFWTPDGGTTLGANSTFVGTDIPVSQDITIGNLVTWLGRALTYGHTVTSDTATITTPTCVAPSLTLNKIVVNDSGRNNVESDWTLTATGATTISGLGASGSTDVVSDGTFLSGTYTLSESGPSGYTASDWTCTGGITVSGGNIISLSSGQTTVCSITNNDTQTSTSSGYMPRSNSTISLPVISPTIVLAVETTTPPVTTTIVPKLPNTGFPAPQNKTNILILAGMVMGGVAFYAFRKRFTV